MNIHSIGRNNSLERCVSSFFLHSLVPIYSYTFCLQEPLYHSICGHHFVSCGIWHHMFATTLGYWSMTSWVLVVGLLQTTHIMGITWFKLVSYVVLDEAINHVMYCHVSHVVMQVLMSGRWRSPAIRRLGMDSFHFTYILTMKYRWNHHQISWWNHLTQAQLRVTWWSQSYVKRCHQHFHKSNVSTQNHPSK